MALDALGVAPMDESVASVDVWEGADWPQIVRMDDGCRTRHAGILGTINEDEDDRQKTDRNEKYMFIITERRDSHPLTTKNRPMQVNQLKVYLRTDQIIKPRLEPYHETRYQTNNQRTKVEGKYRLPQSRRSRNRHEIPSSPSAHLQLTSSSPSPSAHLHLQLTFLLVLIPWQVEVRAYVFHRDG